MEGSEDMALPSVAYLPGYSPRPEETNIGEPPAFVLGGELDGAADRAGDGPTMNPVFGRACQLFDAGFYWESHELWEALWHRVPRDSAEAALLRGLIVLAAAAVKVRQRRTSRVAAMADRAAGLIESAVASGANVGQQVDLDAVRDACAFLRSPAVERAGGPTLAVQVVYAAPITRRR